MYKDKKLFKYWYQYQYFLGLIPQIISSYNNIYFILDSSQVKGCVGFNFSSSTYLSLSKLTSSSFQHFSFSLTYALLLRLTYSLFSVLIKILPVMLYAWTHTKFHLRFTVSCCIIEISNSQNVVLLLAWCDCGRI